MPSEAPGPGPEEILMSKPEETLISKLARYGKRALMIHGFSAVMTPGEAEAKEPPRLAVAEPVIVERPAGSIEDRESKTKNKQEGEQSSFLLGNTLTGKQFARRIEKLPSAERAVEMERWNRIIRKVEEAFIRHRFSGSAEKMKERLTELMGSDLYKEARHLTEYFSAPEQGGEGEEFALLFRVLIYKETDFRPELVSQSGAKGLMQIKETTREGDLLADKGKDAIFDIKNNLEIGIKHWFRKAEAFRRHDGELNVGLANATYNMGSGNMDYVRQRLGLTREQLAEASLPEIYDSVRALKPLNPADQRERRLIRNAIRGTRYAFDLLVLEDAIQQAESQVGVLAQN